MIVIRTVTVESYCTAVCGVYIVYMYNDVVSIVN